MYDVVWENLSKVTFSSTTLQRASGASSTGKATSENMLFGNGPDSRFARNNGYMTYTSNSTNQTKKIGFSVTASKNTEITNAIDYGFAFQSNGKVKAFTADEASALVNYTTSDEMKIERRDEEIFFTVGSTEILRVKIDPTETLMLRAELTSNNSTFSNVKVSFNSKRIVVDPIIDNTANTMKMQITGGFPVFEYSWDKGERLHYPDAFVKEKDFSKGLHYLDIKDSDGREFERYFLLGNDLAWTSFSNTQQSGKTLSKTTSTGWGSALSTTTIGDEDYFWVQYVADVQQLSKAFGITYTGTTFSQYTNLEAGFMMLAENQLQVIYHGNVVLTTEYSNRDALLISNDGKGLQWMLNGKVIYQQSGNFTNDLKVGGLLKDNASMTGVSVFNINKKPYISSWNDTDLVGSITVDISSYTGAAGPFHYLLSTGKSVSLDEVYELTKESIFNGNLDKTKFFEGDPAQLDIDATNEDKTKTPSLLKEHIFSDLKNEVYYVSVYDANGLLIISQEVKVLPALTMFNNSGVVQNTNLLRSNQTNASTDFNFYLDDEIEKTYLDFTIVDATEKYNLGLTDFAAATNTVKYGFHVNNKTVKFIVDGVEINPKYTVKNNNVLSLVKKEGKLLFQINGVTYHEKTLTGDYLYKGQVFFYKNNVPVVANPGPTNKNKFSYKFVVTPQYASCSSQEGIYSFKLTTDSQVQNITCSVTPLGGATPVFSDNSFNKNENVTSGPLNVGIYKVQGQVTYTAPNGVQLLTLTRNYTEYLFVGIEAEMTESQYANNRPEVQRQMFDHLISPNETGFIRFNPEGPLFHSEPGVTASLSGSNMFDIFQNIFYLTSTSYNDIAAESHTNTYLAFRDNYMFADLVYEGQTVVSRLRKQMFWNPGQVDEHTIVTRSTDVEPYVTVIFEPTVIKVYYSLNFDPNQPIRTIAREANRNYWFGKNWSDGEIVNITHSFKCYNSDCSLQILPLGPLCPQVDRSLSVVSETGTNLSQYTYSWQPAADVSCPTCQAPGIHLDETRTFTLNYSIDGDECPQLTREVVVLQENCMPQLCNFNIVAQPDEITCIREIVNLELTNRLLLTQNNVTIEWSPTTYNTDPDSYSTFVFPTTTTEYFVHVFIPGQDCPLQSVVVLRDRECEEEHNLTDIIGCCFSNYGAGVYVTDGTHLNVYCNVINEISIVGGNLEKGEFLNKGYINTTRDWIHNGQNKLFTTYEGKTYLFGDEQSLSGNSNIYYNDLILEGGTSAKKIFTDEYAFHSLKLNDNELATQNSTFSLLSENPNSLTRNTGFVTTEGDEGYLYRNIMNGASPFLYPMAGKFPVFRYRPLELKSNDLPSDVKIHFENINPTTSGLDVNVKAPNVEVVNDKYYYKLFSTQFVEGVFSPNISITAYYNPNDGDFQAFSHWKPSGEDNPAAWWGGTPGNSATTQLNNEGFLSATTTGPMNMNTENFTLARAGFYIGTENFGGTGSTGGNPGAGGTTITVVNTNGTPPSGGLGDPNGTGGTDPVVLTPNPVAGIYQINIDAGTCTIQGTIQFEVTENGTIDPATILYIYPDQPTTETNLLASDLYDIDTENSGLVLSSKPKNIKECVNKLKIMMGSLDDGNEAMILRLDANDLIAEDIIITDESGLLSFDNMVFYHNGALVTTLDIDNQNTSGLGWAPGVYSFDLEVNIDGQIEIVKGQFIVK
jgi:hypothetical protein